MVGSLMDTQLCPSVCVDSLSLSNPSFKSSGDLGSMVGRKQARKAAPLGLSSSFVDSWEDGRLSARLLSRVANGHCRRQRRLRKLVVANELGGQYEEGFQDVDSVFL